MNRSMDALIFAIPLATLVGCTTAAPTAELLSEAEVIHEYRLEATRLELAPYGVWPEHPIALMSHDGRMYYEANIGNQTAQLIWYCSWARYGLGAADREQEDEVSLALLNMSDINQMSIWRHMDDDGHELFNSNLDAARRSDWDALAGFVDAAC
jgi:hypothetical protein